MAASNWTKTTGRWSLYKLLADAARLRLLALAAEAELTVGELCALLDDSQPNVSRHVAALRQAGLLRDRREGTRTFVRLAPAVEKDVVVGDALAEGRRLCAEEGRLERVVEVQARRTERERLDGGPTESVGWLAPELPVYVRAVSLVSTERGVALDVGAGSGGMLDVLAPMFRRVVALVRTPEELERAGKKVQQRGYDNVELLQCSVEDRDVRRRIGEGANAVFASRLLHHAERPRLLLATLTTLVAPGGQLVVIDYDAHEDEGFRCRQRDLWKGFSKPVLTEMMQSAGLIAPICLEVARGFVGGAVDADLPWQIARATRPTARSV